VTYRTEKNKIIIKTTNRGKHNNINNYQNYGNNKAVLKAKENKYVFKERFEGGNRRG